MIYKNETERDTNECIQICRAFNLEPYTRKFLYYDSKGEKKAVAGLMWINDGEGLIVEPFISLASMYGYRLWLSLEYLARDNGSHYIIGGSDNNNIARTLTKNGYKKYQTNINQFVKLLK